MAHEIPRKNHHPLGMQRTPEVYFTLDIDDFPTSHANLSCNAARMSECVSTQLNDRQSINLPYTFTLSFNDKSALDRFLSPASLNASQSTGRLINGVLNMI